MHRSMLLLLAVTVLTACASPPAIPVDDPAPTVDEQRVGVYASVIEELVGAERLDWRRLYVVTTLCDDPADPEPDPDAAACDDLLSNAEQQALSDRLDGARMRFIEDPTPLYDDRWMQGPPRDIVVTLGPIVERGDEVRVGASYGCGGLCGAGSTYVLERRADTWSVVGRRGPMWIA